MAIYREDLVDIELESGTLHRSRLNKEIGKVDNMANRYGVRLFRNGEPVNVEDCSVVGIFMAPDGQNIALGTSGMWGVSGNAAWVQLPQACYNVAGQFTLVIKVISPNATISETARIVDGTVIDTGADSVVIPVATLPTTEEILAAYAQWQAAAVGSVRFDVSQSLTEAEKERARNNIGAGSGSGGEPLLEALGLYVDSSGYTCQRLTGE